MNVKKIILFLIILSVLASCKKNSENDSYSDQLNEIQIYINDNRLEEALDKINLHMLKFGISNRALAIKASIYIRKSNINLKNYIQLENILSRDKKDVPMLLPLELAPKGTQDTVLKINQIYKVAMDLKDRIDDVPLIDFEGARNIFLAIQTLDLLDQPTKGLYLYRSFIKIFYFKFLWENGLLLKAPKLTLCNSPIEKIISSLKDTQYIILTTLVDLDRGLPNSDQELKDTIVWLEGEFSKMYNELNMVSGKYATLFDYLKSNPDAPVVLKDKESLCSM